MDFIVSSKLISVYICTISVMKAVGHTDVFRNVLSVEVASEELYSTVIF